ncbi:Sucrose-phosphate synthase [Heracleum sosnowskyi]|uniref:Sucrose-phosphate synthase n=1 Tax=Heracleum sosnowskyi TaxID=360622 RepID=A0AAD8JA16_9APIA|nr:Sucrose-phosphate synthase [Heracleum sosnowskyi]
MAGNDWINSYLEAILDSGPPIDDVKSSLLLRERGRFSPTRYFVDNVITNFDETDLHRSWLRAQATRSPQERNTRLENMCWRIWNLARQKKQLEEKHARRITRRRIEREIAHREAVADLSEDLSEGEKGDTINDVSPHGESRKSRFSRINSVDAIDALASQQKGKRLYIVLISLHGLIRGENMELGRDSDTGGQVKYVVELARALGSTPGVYRVDLLTRQVSAPDVDWSYAEPTEMLPPRDSEDSMSEMGESSGAYIVRIPFGPKDKYTPKEQLWPHIPEFVDGALGHILQMSKVLGEQIGDGHLVWPVAIHGHYADAGDSAALLSGALNVPMLLTGHSLGRDKLEQLLRQGRFSRDEINSTYKIMRRIEAEELALDASELVITSTRQEIEEQWRLYDGFDPILERKLRARIQRNVSCYGRSMPRMAVIPPGMEFHHIASLDGDVEGETEGSDDPASPDPAIWTEIMRFFTNPRKPTILALARPDPKKNLTTLVKAFGECRPLRELANLILIMGNRDNVDEMSSTSASVLLSIFKLIDKYDLYGQVAYPKHHKQAEVPDIYSLAARTKGVFINPAFIEPFGLTLIEAAAHGLPMVATKNGGPVDIHRVLDNGLLVDPHDQQSIADALLKLVADKQLWAKCRQNGLKNIHLYSWPAHCKTYLARIASCKTRQPRWLKDDAHDENSKTDSQNDSFRDDSLRDIQDISLNLKFPLDGERSGGRDSKNCSAKPEDLKSKIENAALTWSKGSPKGTQKIAVTEKVDQTSSTGKFPILRRRKHMFVIAVDSDSIADIFRSVKKIFEALAKERTEGLIGFILATSFTMLEVQAFLVSEGIRPIAFDAYICNSGSDLYYSSSQSEENPFVVDLYYHSHIEYRWGGEGLRKTLARWAAAITDRKGDDIENMGAEDENISTGYCYAFNVGKPEVVPPVKEVRKLMRIQALRCHVIYCQNGKRINVIPVLASRAQALRYLYLRWGMDLSKTIVFLGESGDTDYEQIVGGLHKSVILKGVGCGSSKQIHANRSYPLTDVMPVDSPNIVQISEECNSNNLRASLSTLGVLKC